MNKEKVQKRIFILLAVGPAFLGYLLFTLYPNVLSVFYSLLNWDGISPAKFVGLDNYKHMFDDSFMWRSIYHSVLYALTVPPLVICIAVVLAYLLNYKGYRESGFFKVLFFFPNVLPIVVTALIWAFMYDGSFGLLNSFLKMISLDIGDFYWLGEKDTAFWALIPPQVWGGVGFYVVIFINAMAGIPKSLYESAVLEGANHMQRLWYITLPLINGILRVSLLFLVLGVFRTIDIVLIMTNGGPGGSTDVIGLYIFNLAFGTGLNGGGSHSFGYASAIGMFLFVILVGSKLLIDRFMPKNAAEF